MIGQEDEKDDSKREGGVEKGDCVVMINMM